MSQSLLKIAADFTVQLASAVAIGDTTATLSSIADDDSVSLPSGLYGFTIDNGQSNKEYIICTLTGTALTDIKSISRQGAVTTGFTKTHRRGSKVSITDWAILKRILDNLNGTTGFDSGVNLGYDGTPTGLTGNQFATVNYVLSVVNGGTVTFDKQVISNQVAGENLTANDIVYFKEADQKWWKADANAITPSTQAQLGLAGSTVVTDATLQIFISGPINTFTGLTAGSKYYLSDTAGSISTTEGSNPILIGWALSTTTILLNTTNKTLPIGTLSTTVNPENILIEDNASAASTDQVQGTQNGTVEVGEADATLKKNKIAQSFIPERTKIRGVSLYKSADSGTFTGTVTISIQADSSGSPSGSALASKVYSNGEWSLVAVGEFEALFSSEISLTIGATYWIVIETSTSDNTNHPNVGTNTAGGYTKGSVKYKNTTDNWTAIATIDLYFKTLEGNNNQVVKTNANGKIESAFYDITEMPVPSFQQRITVLDKTTVDVNDYFAFGSNQTGTVFYHLVNGATLYRYERDSYTGFYIQTHQVSITSPVPAHDTGSIIQIGLYIYIFGNDGTNIICRRYLAADLTGETLMTVPTVASTAGTIAWTDGKYAYVVSSLSTTSRKWSVSGTTFTAVSTATVNSILIDNHISTMFDGTNAFIVRYDISDKGIHIYKLTNIDGSSYTDTLKKFEYPAADYLGNMIVNIDSNRIYLGTYFATANETANERANIQLIPVTKP